MNSNSFMLLVLSGSVLLLFGHEEDDFAVFVDTHGDDTFIHHLTECFVYLVHFHGILSVAGVGTPEPLGDSPIVVSFVETAGSAVASRMPAVEVVHAVGLNVFRRTSDQDSGEALVATSLVAALDSEGRIK